MIGAGITATGIAMMIGGALFLGPVDGPITAFFGFFTFIGGSIVSAKA